MIIWYVLLCWLYDDTAQLDDARGQFWEDCTRLAGDKCVLRVTSNEQFHSQTEFMHELKLTSTTSDTLSIQCQCYLKD